MIPINFPSNETAFKTIVTAFKPKTCFETAQKALTEIEQLPTMDEKKALFDKKGYVWGNFKDALLKLSYGKCWFTERMLDDHSGVFDVEHFRPKREAKNLDDTIREGYWRLAFDWRNLRVCKKIYNIHKSSYFPLFEGSPVATCFEEIEQEQPYFIDPTQKHEVELITFRFTKGLVKAVESFKKEENERNHERARISIQYFYLNFDNLEQLRGRKWEDCQDCLENLEAHWDNELSRQRNQNTIHRLIAPQSELAGTARACVRQFIKTTLNEELASFLKETLENVE